MNLMHRACWMSLSVPLLLITPACGPTMFWNNTMHQGMDVVKACVEGRRCYGTSGAKSDAEYRLEVSRFLNTAVRAPRLPAPEVIGYLLEQGADPNYKNDGLGEHPSIYGAMDGSDYNGQSRNLSDAALLPIV
ncbi:MAG: hypothetical protein JXR96_13500, partial [Deltaproteobacteria bacterium]|nr:hypothetical protein [Deltaproteobacteria bacterium]